MIRVEAGLSMVRFCELAGIPQSTWYRRRALSAEQSAKGPWPAPKRRELEAVVHWLALRYELYPEVVDACEEEGGVPSRLLKTDAGDSRREGTPCQMFAGSPSGRTTRVASRSTNSRGRGLAG